MQIVFSNASWNELTWISEPSVITMKIFDKLKQVKDLQIQGIQVLCSLSSQGTSLTFFVINPLYKDKCEVDKQDIEKLSKEIEEKLNYENLKANFNFSNLCITNF